METLKVFISGTMRDLKRERQVVAEAVAGLRYQALRAETLGAVDRSSRQACLDMARGCDVYIGLYGDRYGWVPDGDAFSVTEQEYNEARRLGKPMLIYVKGDAREPGREEAQQAFLNRVLEFDSGYFACLHFTELADLREAVQRDLLRLVTEIVRQRGRAAIPTALRPPAPPRHFVGRAAQMEELRRLLGGGGTAVISGAVAKLVGMGGLGKTALAAYAAQELAAEFPDGVLWAELGRSSIDDILTAIAGFYHLDLSRCPDQATKAAAVRGLLEKKRALLVLDNAERNDQLEPFQMGAGARCGVLVTTRRDDLAALRHAQRVGLPLLSESEALDLLRGIAGPERVEAEPEVAKEILAMVGYLPLAVDIVASRLRERPEWSLGEMRRRLADSKRRLEELEIGEDYGVRLSFDMSYNLLEPEAQRFFAWIGVFGGVDFDVAASAAVAQVEGREAERTLERLRHLALAQPGRRASRYALHPLLRDYACAHLDDQDAHRRMAAHYLAVAEEAGGKLKGKEIEDGLAMLDEEISNIRAGQAWAVGSEGEVACELVRDYIDAMTRYFSLRTHWYEWIEWSQAGLRACEELGDIHGMATIYINLGVVYAQKGEWERALEFYQKDLEISEKVGDIHGMAQTWNNLGEVYRMKGEWERAIKFYQKALSTMEKIGDLHGMGLTYNNLGNVYMQKGEWERAIEFYQKSLETKETVGDVHGMAGTWNNLGEVCRIKGEWERAIEFYQKALEISEELGDIHGMAQTWANLGFLYEAQGAYERALDYLERSLEVLKEIGAYEAAEVEEGVRRVRGKVALSLSTAKPALATILPELRPWYVSVPAPPPPRAAPAMAARLRKAAFAPPAAEEPAPEIMLAEVGEEEAEPIEMEAVTAEVEETGAALTFRVAKPATIPSDGSPHKTTVAALSLTPRLDYVAVPKLVSQAYRRATVTNDTDYVFLPGPTNVFHGGEYVGTTTLATIVPGQEPGAVAPGQEYKVFLGVDERIKVSRELVASEVDKKFIGDKRRLHYAYRIKVQNLRDGREKIIVSDQIPVARHEEIKVRLDMAEPKPTKQTELGILKWELDLEPGEEQAIRFDFNVEHPRSLTVVGLPKE